MLATCIYEAYLKGNYTNSLFFIPTTPREIESITALFKNKKSFSFDRISTNLIKASISEISVPLSEIINLIHFKQVSYQEN